MISGYLHLKNRKISYGPDLGPFGYLLFFGAQKLRGLITADPDVLYICNFACTFCIKMSKMWQCANFQFLSEEGPMEMGQFWVPESAVGPKSSNFQQFGVKFGLYSLILVISTWKTGKTNLGPICAPFGVLTLFGAQKLRGLISMEIVL